MHVICCSGNVDGVVVPLGAVGDTSTPQAIIELV